MQLTLSAAFTLFTYAVSSVSASNLDAGSHIGRSVHAARDYEFADVAAAYEAGQEDPRLNKRVVKKRFDPNTQALTKIGLFDSQTQDSAGYLYVFGDSLRNTTTQPSTFQYTKPANVGDNFDLEFPIQGGTATQQLVVATRGMSTYGLNSPTVSAAVRSDLYGAAYPLRSPPGSVPVLDRIEETWFESAVWSAAEDGTLTCTWINPDGTPVPLQAYLIIEALHFSPNTSILWSWGGPWFDIKTVTLKLVN